MRNFWTRLNYWVINKELKVYRELGTANGFLYPEVKSAAQQGRETPILLLNRHGQQIVSMAEPIKRGNKILGVLLLSTKPGDIDDVLWDERWLILQIAAMALVFSVGEFAGARTHGRGTDAAAFGGGQSRHAKYFGSPGIARPDGSTRRGRTDQPGVRRDDQRTLPAH